MTARLPAAAAWVALLALLLASPAAAGPLRKALRFAVRQAVGFVEARRTIEAAREWRERLRAVTEPQAAWPTVRAEGSSTAPAAMASRPRPASEDRPRGPRR